MRFADLVPEATVLLLAVLSLTAGRAQGTWQGGRTRAGRRSLVPVVTAAGLMAALVVELWAGSFNGEVIAGVYASDRFALFAKAGVLLVLLMITLAADWDAEPLAGEGWRPLGLGLLAGLGAMVAAASPGIAGLGVGLGIGLIAFALASVGQERGRRRLQLGVLGMSAILAAIALAGIAATTGHSGLADIHHSLGGHHASVPIALFSLVAAAGLGAPLVVAASGFGRRVSPFSGGAGAGVGPVLAGVVLVKLLGAVAPPAFAGWAFGLQVSAVVCIAAGSLAALGAARPAAVAGWLAISQSGWVLAGLSTHDRAGTAAALFLLVGLGLAAGLVVAALAVVETAPGVVALGLRQPARAALLGASLLSLAGVPPLVGFFGEFGVASELVRSGGFWVVASGLGGAVVSTVAVARTLRQVFIDPLPDEARRPAARELAGLATAGALAGAAVVAGLGLFANPVFGLAVQAATALGLR